MAAIFHRSRHLGQAVITDHMTIGVVVALEKIDIDHDQAQRTLLPGATPELDVQRTLEQAAIAQTGQAVMGGNQLQRFLGLAQIRLDSLADAHLANEHPTEHPHTEHDQGNDEAGMKRGFVPPRKNRILRRSRRDHQWISLQLSVAKQADNAVHQRSRHGAAGGRPGQEFLEDFAPGQRRADLRLDEGPACQQRSIGQPEEHRAVVVDAEAFEELVEVRHFDPGHQHALELTVLVVHPPGNRNDPLTVFPAANRRADVRHGRHILLMELEVLAIRDARTARHIVERSHHPLPFLIEQKNAVQLIQRLHASGKGFLQARSLGRAKPVDLNPVHQTGEHQIGLHERIFSLLRHGSRQVRRSDLGLAQVVAAGLFQLQVKQTTQAQTHGGDEKHRSLAQRQAFRCDAGGVMRIIWA